ncbi:hypothetical protein SDC9_78913 [bioreactor metagenome]|uniref:Uncharacterized protein n=1 Tax=bioreactor metagenome TaxID=1076179 RepID=A0A644YWX6_9ZZZZ
MLINKTKERSKALIRIFRYFNAAKIWKIFGLIGTESTNRLVMQILSQTDHSIPAMRDKLCRTFSGSVLAGGHGNVLFAEINKKQV